MRVLIVDDDMATVDVIRDTVHWERLGITNVQTAYNIESAKKLLLVESADIIISDIEMPMGSGIDLMQWFREQAKDGEFLLLTCHENFQYAANALKLQAAEYMLKPFDVTLMEVALQKVIQKIQNERQIMKESEYGKWVSRNRQEMQLSFLRMIFDGKFQNSQNWARPEISARNLDIDPIKDYRLVISRITNIEADRERMNQNLTLFILENIHSEVLRGKPENLWVTCYDHQNYYVVVTVCENGRESLFEGKCSDMLESLKSIFNSTVTCCISKSCNIEAFYEAYHRALNMISVNVAYYGMCFKESQIVAYQSEVRDVLDLKRMEELLTGRKKNDFLNYLKSNLVDKANSKTLNEQVLKRVQQEILQVVYAYLGQRGIQASHLFTDQVSIRLNDHASRSMLDMIRWVSYQLDRTFTQEDEVVKSYTLIDKIHQYIKKHYREDIGRNEIAAEFGLAPEYLAKIYKKQTGSTIHDDINLCRIEQAKLFLKNEELRVSDVAESVGFENFTYFSTVFKKYTGMTPNQYRKQ